MVRRLDSYVPEMLPRLEYQTGQTLYTPQPATEEERNIVKPLDCYVPETLPRLEYQTGQTLYSPQSALSQISNETSINLPPSFTTLLSGCYPNSTLGNILIDLACSGFAIYSLFPTFLQVSFP